MRRIAAALFPAFILLSNPALAQQQAEATGNVIVHVICADTGAPARYIDVILHPVPDLERGPLPNREPVRDSTDGDGNVMFSNVPVGIYFIDAELPGYIQPRRLISSKALNSKDPKMRALVLNAVPHVAVGNATTARAAVTLERGAILSGRVTYGDGTPIENVPVEITLIKGAPSAEAEDALYRTAASFRAMTDDRGIYRVAGLSPGTYIASARIVKDHMTMQMIGKNNGTLVTTQPGAVDLTFYAPGTPLRTKAQQIAVARGDEQQGIDLVADLGSLHSLGGYVNRHGEVMPGTSLELDDMSDPVNRHAAIADEMGYFRFDLLPKGNYVLKVFTPATFSAPGKNLFSTPLLVTNTDKVDLNVDVLSKPQ